MYLSYEIGISVVDLSENNMNRGMLNKFELKKWPLHADIIHLAEIYPICAAGKSLYA